jgi:N-acetylgalactosamine-6-sulfatase
MVRKQRSWILLVGALVELAIGSARAESEVTAKEEVEPRRRPNVIMLFADDLGYGDLGCYGHPYAKTPNLDRLATQGTLFRKFNVTGITCNPSRTGLFTSRHPNSFPLKTADYGFDQARYGHKDRITIMELLHDAGYKTGHFGKWDIGPDESDGTYGIDEINVRGGGGSDPRGRDEMIYADAIAFIEDNKDVPFYLNVMGRITHSPVDPRPDLITSAGFDDLVVDRADFPGQQIQDIFDGVEDNGGNINTSMRSYLTEVYYLDLFIGELLEKLDELGLSDNTIVAFSSDQGAAVPNYDDDPIPAKEYNLVGWSGGLRGQKHDQHEGGVRSPFILRWPGHVPAGKINTDSITSALDWLPTLCRIAEVPIDKTQFQGEDVLDIWLGSDRSRTRPQFWNSSMKKDDWRIYFQNSRSTEAVELYDLSTDLAETNNLVTERPDVVADLTATWQLWQASKLNDGFLIPVPNTAVAARPGWVTSTGGLSALFLLILMVLTCFLFSRRRGSRRRR